jgi:hypothetical protein
MKSFLPFLVWLWPCLAFSQVKESLTTYRKDTMKNYTATYAIKPEVLSSGFIDIVNNGQVNASARFIRLFIGEPGKVAIPLSIYSGVSSNNFQNPQVQGGIRSNEQLVANFINPLSGLINISVDGILFFKRKKQNFTRAGWSYHIGSRVLTGYEAGFLGSASLGRPLNFFNGYGTSGIYVQTGAWERNNARNMGVFWINGRYIVCKSGINMLKKIVPDLQSDGFYHGWSLAWGIEINNLVNIKVIYYKYIKRPEIDYTFPVYQLSFNYSMR